ncbi:MAG TPA: 1,4-alpha-glucan branching protein GlgB [Acidimicrobiia bacterium]
MPVNADSLLTEDDIFLWNEGTHHRLYEKLGAHPTPGGTHFAVWAPNADRVSVIGDWNHWEPESDRLSRRGTSGIWEGFVPEAREMAAYKFRIGNGRFAVSKADPFGFHHETPPATASKIWSLDYTWNDRAWMTARAGRSALTSPISVYEAHIGSWKRHDDHRPMTYRELADDMPAYVAGLGFTHVELLPVMEHPFYGSWGYQTTGYFAPTSRYGTPQDFMALVDAFHEAEVGVILDWVPSHFPSDEHGLAYFDGTHLFEHADPRQGFHPDWKTLVYNYGRSEIPAFLISSALFWLDRYHIDGIRVDAVASMLYLDYSREDGAWIPNRHGGNENLEAVRFLQDLNQVAYQEYPDIQMIAEESTAWPMVSRPTNLGGLGFGLKWDMGWMHDTLDYLARNPIYRSYHHHQLTFRSMYSFTENFLLPLSHDEVVHGKKSLLRKMPGDEWQRFANLRLLLGMMYGAPGKKLLFMGAEFAQEDEWDHESQLDWGSRAKSGHDGISRLVGDLNRVYKETPALHEYDCDPSGFFWGEPNDSANGVIAHFRAGSSGGPVLVVHNMTPVPHVGYRIGVSAPGRWVEILNTDAEIYGGSGYGNFGVLTTAEPPIEHRGFPHSVEVTIPPLATVMLRYDAGSPPSSPLNLPPEERRGKWDRPRKGAVSRGESGLSEP